MSTKVLLVEDEAFIAMATEHALLRRGFDVCRVVASGEDALVAVAEDSPDVIVMDIHLAGKLDGLETAKHVRAFASTPIIFVTGYSPGRIRESLGDMKRIAFLEKPMATSALEATIESILCG